MNLKKIVAAVAAAAMAVTMTAVNVFAATVQLDAEYPGAWGGSACISKADLEAVGGDVKVTLNVTTKLLLEDQIVLRPMDFGAEGGWKEIAGLTSDTEVAKADGFIVLKKSQTTVSFVITADTIASLSDTGMGFQVYNVTVNSADLEAGSPEGAFKPIEDKVAKKYSSEKASYEELMGVAEEPAAEEAAPAEEEAAPAEEEAAPAEEEAAPVEEEAAPAEEEAAEEPAVEETTAAVVEETTPAADSNTTSSGTGNTSAIAIVSVMAVAAAAAITVKKAK